MELKKENGITIVSLVVTIIVLIILAGVTINAVLNDGIIENATKAKFVSEIVQIKEEVKIRKLNDTESVRFTTLKKVIGRDDKYNEMLSIENGKVVHDVEKVSDKQKEWLHEMEIEAKQGIIPVYTKEQFYKIGSGEDIQIEENTYNFSITSTYYLQNNIDLECDENNQWIPIGNTTNPFEGVLDGQNYSISGLYISNEEINQGLFGIISGTIRNLTIEDSYINSNAGRAYIGTFAGKATDTAQIINCVNKATVESTNSVGGSNGAIVGVNKNGGNLTLSYNIGKIGSSGICGENLSDSKVANCYNTQVVTGDSWSAGISAQNKGTISNCYNIGVAVNGIAGNNTATMQYCYYLSGASSKIQIDSNTGTTENCSDKTEEEFKEEEFLTLINSGNEEDVFIKDTYNVNNGYPILKWQTEE